MTILPDRRHAHGSHKRGAALAARIDEVRAWSLRGSNRSQRGVALLRINDPDGRLRVLSAVWRTWRQARSSISFPSATHEKKPLISAAFF
jgi:hypothetical protein